MKLNLVESKGDRNIVMSKASEGSVNLVDLLKKYGKVVDYMTEPMVADFYEVTSSVINNIGTRNKNELEQYGYRAYKKSEVEKLLKTQDEFLENIPNRGLRLYPIKSVIVVGMMLTESEVAEHLRKDIMEYVFSNKRRRLTKREELLLKLFNTNDPIELAELSKELSELEETKRLKGYNEML